LGVRVGEHKKALTSINYKSNVADHAIINKHNIDFSNPTIIYNESNFKALRFLESWNIEQNKLNNIKLMNDKQNSKTCIPKQYVSLLHK